MLMMFGEILWVREQLVVIVEEEIKRLCYELKYLYKVSASLREI
jgi:hypothetical protein